MSNGITQLQKKNLAEFKRLSETLFLKLVDALKSLETYQPPRNLLLRALQLPMAVPRREDIDRPTFDFVNGLLHELNNHQVPVFNTPRSKSSYYLLLNGVPDEQTYDDAIKKYDPKCVMIGIDDYHLFAMTLNAIDWEQKIADFQKSGGTVIFIPESDPALMIDNVWRTCRIHNPTQIDNFAVITLGDVIKQQIVAEQISQTLMLSITQLGFFHDECVMLWNTYRNLKTGKVSTFTRNDNAVTDIPVFVVASGPSLQGDIDFICDQQSNAIILSVATALRPLLDSGITPDFHIELENVYITPKLVDLSKDHDLSNIRLVAAAAVEPEVLTYFDHAILYAREALSSYPLFASGLHETLSLPGPTAGNAALSFALESGFKDIYLFGLDLGTRNPQQHHIRGSYYDTEDAPEHVDEYNIEIPGNFVDVIWTSRAFYSAQINADDLIRTVGAKASVKNCSDGARLPHAKPIRSKDVKFAHNADKSECIRAVCKQFSNISTERVIWPNDILMPEVKSLFQILRSILKNPDTLQDGSYETALLETLKLPLGYRDPPTMGADMSAIMLVRGTVLAMTLFMERYRNRVGSPKAIREYAEQAAAQYHVMLDELEQTATQLFAGDEPNQPTHAEDRIAPPDRVFPKPMKISRNADCPCGSGQKYKRCHGKVA